MFRFFLVCLLCLQALPASCTDVPAPAAREESLSRPVLWDVDWDSIDWRFNPELPFLFIKSTYFSRAFVSFSPEVKAGDLFPVPQGKGRVFFQVTEVERLLDGGSYGFSGVILKKVPDCVKKKVEIDTTNVSRKRHVSPL